MYGFNLNNNLVLATSGVPGPLESARKRAGGQGWVFPQHFTWNQ